MAVSLLMLIVFAFTPLFLGSIERIYFAGDKSEALYQGQADMEVRIVEKETIDGYQIIFEFAETTVTVPGGLIEVEHSEGRAEAWLSTFLPYVPTIQLNIDFPAEGYDVLWDGLPVVIMGRNTKLGAADYVYLYTRQGFENKDPEKYKIGFNLLTGPPTGVPAGFDQYARFNLPGGLTNADSPYIVEMKWQMGDIEVKVRTRLHVMLPFAAAVGNSGEILVSPNANATWNVRTHNVTTQNINDIIWSGFKYIAVTSNGDVITWENQKEPVLTTIPGLGIVSLNSLAYGNGVLVAVGDGGTVAVSSDGKSWELKQLVPSYNLHAVSWNGSEFAAVGTGGTILKLDNDGSVKGPASVVDPFANLYGVAYGNNAWLVAGETRVPAEPFTAVIYRDLGSGWSQVYNNGSGNTALHDICYNRSEFAAVGSNGMIMTSADGNSWNVSTFGSGKFYRVVWDNFWNTDPPIYIVVGEAGTILTGTAGTWKKQTTGSTKTLKGVAFRWSN